MRLCSVLESSKARVKQTGHRTAVFIGREDHAKQSAIAPLGAGNQALTRGVCMTGFDPGDPNVMGSHQGITVVKTLRPAISSWDTRPDRPDNGAQILVGQHGTSLEG